MTVQKGGWDYFDEGFNSSNEQKVEESNTVYDAEIYNVNGDVTTDGSAISNLSPYKDWTFQVQGIGATGATLAIQVTLDGTNYDYLGLKQIGISGNPVSTVVADGVYVVSHTAGSANVWYGTIAFNGLKVDRIAAGTGVGDLVVRALGHK